MHTCMLKVCATRGLHVRCYTCANKATILGYLVPLLKLIPSPSREKLPSPCSSPSCSSFILSLSHQTLSRKIELSFCHTKALY